MAKTTQRRVLITGVSSGIGAAAGRLARDRGWLVIGLDRNEPEGGLVDDFHSLDLASPESLRAVAARIGAHEIDALCNVAGVSGQQGSNLVMRVNVLAVRELSNLLLPALTEGGAIVNVGSFAGENWATRLRSHLDLLSTDSFESGLRWLEQNPISDDASYRDSKEVIRVWTRIAAADWLKRGVRVNSVSPGPVQTPILGEFRRSLGEERVANDIAVVGRPADPREVAEALIWLCSSDARWVTGANIPVDGGLAVTTEVQEWAHANA